MKRIFVFVSVIIITQFSIGQIQGSGTTGYLPKFTNSTTVGNSLIYQSGSSIGIGTINPDPFMQLDVNGLAKFGGLRVPISGGTNYLEIGNGNTWSGEEIDIYIPDLDLYLLSYDLPTEKIYIGGLTTIDRNTNYFGINNQSPQTNLHVKGTARIDGGLLQFYNNQNALADISSTASGKELIFRTNGTSEKMRITSSGNILINKTSQSIPYKMDVSGGIRADSVIITSGGADFVFENNYNLKSLNDVEKFVKENKHLPEVPSAEQMQNGGTSVGYMQTKLLQKVEELTLYLIEQDKRIKTLEEENKELREKN